MQGAHTEDLADQHKSPSEHQGPGGWCEGEDPEGDCGLEMWEITLMWDSRSHRDLLGYLSCSHYISVSQLLGNEASAHLLPSSSLTGVKITNLH